MTRSRQSRPCTPVGLVGRWEWVASSTAVLTDDWSNRTATSIMRLRPGIATGFYIERMHLASATLYGTGYCMLDLV